MRKYLWTVLLMAGATFQQVSAQVTVGGAIQSDMMIMPQQDSRIGTAEYDNKYFLTNTYLNLNLQSREVDAGVRFELTQWPMPGYAVAPNQDFKGWGLPNAWIKGKARNFELTMGTFYEQFGSGFVLRTYEERTLGIDNSLLGARAIFTPGAGFRFKVLTGAQRNYWEINSSLVSGADMEWALEDVIKPWRKNGTHLTLGASWVNKWEKNRGEMLVGGGEYCLNVPRFVNAFDGRVRFQKAGFSVLGEYAYKSADPNTLNGGIYRPGQSAMLSLSYSKKGLSALVQAKRADNMAFRSKRADSHSTTSFINHQPAFTLDHTYSLAALYPYATMLEGEQNGEWAYQAALGYKFKGRYAPKFKANYSLVQSIDRSNHTGSLLNATDGYGSAFWKWGKECYYQDADLQYEQRLSKNWDIHAMYMYQDYNRIVQKHEGHIRSHIFVFEPKWKINKKLTLRAEAQYLLTDHPSGDWGFGLLELSVAPYLMFSVSDQIGRPELGDGETYGKVTHYYNACVAGSFKSHRLQISYGRTRAGVNCTGGVCRYIPASRGLTINYNYNF